MSEKDNILGQFADIKPEILEMLKATEIDMSIPIPEPEHLISKDGKPVCTRGNFSIIVGLAGSRKSFLCTAIAGAFLNNEYMGLSSNGCNEKLIWIDTEQAEGHVQRIGRRLNKICKIPSNAKNDRLIMYHWRDRTPEDRKQGFEAVLKLYQPSFIVLDGVSDLITDPNNVEQSTEIINELMNKTSLYNCHILTVIHANVGSEKARGHLGSEALRKCETAILVTAKDSITKCSFQKTRDIRPEDFSFSVMNNLPILASYEEVKVDKVFVDLMKVMPKYPNTISSTDLKKKLIKECNIQERTAKDRISKGAEMEYIKKNDSGLYHLLPPCEDNQIELFM